jgi:cell division transport system permease protein
LLADGVLWGAACWLLSQQPELVSVLSVKVMVLVSIGVFIFGILITWLCAFFSINKFLRMKATTLYYI